MNDLRLVLVTFPTLEAARQIGTALVEMQLAACVNFISNVESVYRWQGEVESATETLAIFKTSAGAVTTLELELKRRHPYEVPEFIVIESIGGSRDYQAWVLENVRVPGAYERSLDDHRSAH